MQALAPRVSSDHTSFVHWRGRDIAHALTRSLSGLDWGAFAKLFMSVSFVLYCFITFPPQCFHGLFCKFRNSELAAMWFPASSCFKIPCRTPRKNVRPGG